MTRPIICALLLGGHVFAANLQRSAQLSSPVEDAERIGRLRKTGQHVESDRVTTWVSAGAMSAAEMKTLVDRLSIGVSKLEAEAVVDVLPEGDPHNKLEALSKMTMNDLRSEWMKKIGVPVQSR